MTWKVPNNITEGWFDNYSNEEYHNGKLKALISSSDWKEFDRSPAHYMAAKKQTKEPTAALNFGSAFHSICMEFDSEVVIEPLDINKRTKIGRAEYTAFCEENKDKYIVKADEYKSIKAMVDAVHRHKYAKELIKTSYRELTGIFKDIGTGLWCKIRTDYIDFERFIISDLKTTIDAGFDKFSKDIFNLKYNWSAAWYKHGARILSKEDFTFILIAVEKTPPYGVNTFILDGRAIKIAWERIFSLTGYFAECLKKDKWPSYDQKILEPDIPAWVKWEKD